VSTVKVTSATGGAGGGTTCTITAYASISSAVASCSNIVLSSISAPASSSIDLSKLKTGATVTFAGKTTFGTTADDDFNPIVISGTDVTITGAAGNIIDGNGQAYWDGQGSNGGTAKPDHFIVAKDLTNAVFSNLNIQNYPVHCFDITGGDTITLSNIRLDNSAGNAANSASDGEAAAHNSDGFDISSTDNLILENSWVSNQDDCVAVNSGSDITFRNGYCSGGHGLSIGSVGGRDDNTVDGVYFLTNTVTKSVNGIRVKGIEGDTGTIKGVEYDGITLSSISKYGILIEQNYDSGDLDGGTASSGIPITGLIIKNIVGTGAVSSSGYDVVITCGSGACTGWTWSGVAVTGGKKYGSCTNVPSVAACS